MPLLPLRLAILECDTPLTETRAQYGSYSGVFTTLLRAGASSLPSASSSSSASALFTLSTFDVVTAQAYPSLSDIDAVLLTGSRHSSFDNDPWILKLVAFVRRVLDQRRVRIIGVCFGHQILGRALGAKVARSELGWEISVTDMQLTEKGRELFGRTTLALHQMHRDIVCAYPEGVEPLASTDHCAVQAMHAPRRFLSVQGHPEFTADIVREIVEVRRAAGLFTEEMERDALERLDRAQDGVVVAQAFWRFLLED